MVNDNDALNSDVRLLQQERTKLRKRILELEKDCEDLSSERDNLSEEKRREREDFEAQIEANEKNLLSYRKFIEEQTHEREMERDEYNKELVALTERLKDKDKIEAKLKYRIEELETQINSLIEDKCLKEKQLSDINSQLKCANHEISELRAVIAQMEKESDKCNHLEKQLRTKVNDLNEALELQIKINEETQHDVFTTSLLERITSKTHQLQNTLGSPEYESESEDTSIECSYNDVRQLSEKLNALNDCIDKLLIQNNSLKSELDKAKGDNRKDYQELVKEKESLERNLMEIMRSNEVLQEELNSKHLQLSAFKSRLETSLEKRREREDIEAQIEANEKNLLSYRKFIEEQTREREMERDEYNKELVALTERLKDKDKNEAKFKYRLAEMETRISSLTEDKSFKEKQLSDINSQLNCANHEISELKGVITHMEKESNKFNDSERKLLNKVNELNKALELEIKINEQTQEKLDSLNDCIDKLLIQNNNLKLELELDKAKGDKTIDRKDYQKIVKEKDSLERKLLEIIRSNEVLQEELNNKHIQLNAFKSRLDASLEKYVEDDEKLQGVTNQFLWKLKRVISHKNALIYQKKYLLHVLGGFQLTERATLALLANMNVTGIEFFFPHILIQNFLFYFS